MKKLLLFLFFTVSVYSQTSTEKWNSLLKRYEYFDSNGTMTGYKQYNSLRQSWEYYDSKASNQVQQPPSLGDLELARSVLSSKQQKYDENLAKVRGWVESCYTVLAERKDKVSDDTFNRAISDFETHVKKINNFDFSSDVNTSNTINFLVDVTKKIACNYFKECN